MVCKKINIIPDEIKLLEKKDTRLAMTKTKYAQLKGKSRNLTISLRYNS